MRLTHGGIVQVHDAEAARIEGDELICTAADGHVVCTFPRLDVLAYSPHRHLVEGNESNGDLPGGP